MVKLDNIFFVIVREVIIGLGLCYVKLGWLVGWNGGGVIRVEKFEGFDVVEEDFVVRKLRDIRMWDIFGSRGWGKIFVGGEFGG